MKKGRRLREDGEEKKRVSPEESAGVLLANLGPPKSKYTTLGANLAAEKTESAR